MSLSKQMTLFISALLIVLLFGTFLLNISNTKQFLEEQLSSHAQDTATSLGLSLSSIGDPEDISSMETMINAVFDRGYYAKIALVDMDEKPIYSRENPNALESIPEFFMQLIHIEGPQTEALVQGGWVPIGKLTVQSHPGYAYLQLWDSTKSLSTWFALAAIFSILLAIYTLKHLLKPIKKIQRQAEAIVKKEYLIQDKIPKTTELKQIVSAMNSMVGKMKDIFERDAKQAEKLQKIAYQDGVTGLSNRLHFEMNVDSLLDKNEDNTKGAILLIRVNQLKELNDQYGYLLGDKLMQALSESMTQHVDRQALFARLNGTELIAVIPTETGSDLIDNAVAIAESTQVCLQSIKAFDAPTSVSVAVTDYEPGDRRGPLLAKLDFAIQEANKLGQNKAYYYQLEEQASSEQQTQEVQWLKRIDDAIQEKRFVLFEQSAYHREQTIHNKELFIRLKDDEGNIHSAGFFMPAVDKLNKTAQIDRLVIELAFDYLAKTDSKVKLAINLTKSIIETNEIKDWLIKTLTLEIAAQLAFEVSEKLITQSEENSAVLIKALKQRGMTFGIDHFGSQFGNMNYLQTIRPDYIKLDGAFSKAIERDDQTRTYVESLCELCHSLDIQIIAMSVETESQQQAFKALGINYYQGYLYGAPQPL